MDVLREMFPTLSPVAIQSVFTKSGGSVEDAIEALLKISNSEPEQTVGQGEGSGLLSLQANPHNTQNWPHNLYGQTGSYFNPEWSESTTPSYSSTTGSQHSYIYNQTYPHGGFAEEQSTSGYSDSYLSGFVSSSGGQSIYGYGGQRTWTSGLPGVQQERAESSYLLDTPSSSGGSSLTSSPSHAPQVAAVSYSRALNASPKRTPHSPKMKTSQLNQTRVNKPKKRLIIMRGLPGSGKSTLARELKGRTGVICSTDDFFIQNGQYVYDPSKLAENHDKNKKKVQEAMEAGTTPVIVDNTNLSSREMEPYVLLGVQYGYSTEFREPNTGWRRKPHELARRNSHCVPEYKIRSMMDRFEKRVTVESVLASQAYSTSPASRHESKEGVLSCPAVLPSFHLQRSLPKEEEQQHSLLNPSCHQPAHDSVTSLSEVAGKDDPTLPVSNTELSHQPWEEESKEHDSMGLLQAIPGSNTTAPGTAEDYSSQQSSSLYLTASQQSSSQYLTASQQSLQVDLLDYYGFTYDSSISAHSPADLGVNVQYTEECPETQSGVMPSSGGNQMPVFGTTSAVQPSVGHSFPQDSPEYKDPINTRSNTENATLSDLSSDLSQDEPPILSLPPQRQEDIPPPLEGDPMRGPASFPVQSHSKVALSYWSAGSTAGGGFTEDSNNKVYSTAPSLVGLHLASLERQLVEEGADHDRTIAPQLADGKDTSTGDVLVALADMTLSGTQMPLTVVGEVPGGTLAQSAATGPAPTTVQSQASDVLVFLRDCFPEQAETFLMHCWECSYGNIDVCMDLVLTSSFKDSDEGEAPREFPTEYETGEMSDLPAPKSVVEVKHGSPPSWHSSNTSGTSSLGAPLAEEMRHHSAPAPQAVTDEEFARQLQAEYDQETVSSSQSAAVPQPQPAVEQPVAEQPRHHPQSKEKGLETQDEEYFVKQYGEDEGFVLRLPQLLAYRLQDMYGSVSQHTEGDDLSSEDLVVLLSEQVAKSLYNLWVKTLKAKQDEIAVQRDLQRQRKQDTSAGHFQEAPSSPPRPVHTRSPSKKHSQRRQRRKKFVPLARSLSEHSTAPKQAAPAKRGAGAAREPSLLEIMDEQQAQEMGAEQYSAIVDHWLDTDRAARLQVNNLYRKHRNVSRDVINRYLVQTEMNIDAVDDHLCYVAGASTNTVSVFKRSQNPTPAATAKEKPDPYADSSSSRASDDRGGSGVYQEYDNPAYQDYRAEAQLQARLRHEAFQKAAAAWQANKRDLASHYAAQGRKHSEQMEDANYRAAQQIYQKNSQCRGRNSIDLHGLHVTEALSILEEELSQARGRLEIITGQGSHSHRGVPRLKKAVLNLLSTKGLDYDIPSHNPGVIIVDLARWKGRR